MPLLPALRQDPHQPQPGADKAMMEHEQTRQGADGRPWPSMLEAFWVWSRIALLSFGGPAGQIALMHRILVEEKRWVGDGRFLHALNFCMLLPGPEAQQLAVYIGWLMHRAWGGLIAGVLFVLPGAVTILALSIVYAFYGSVGWVAALFYGLKTAVLAVVLLAVTKLGQRVLGNNTLLAIAGLSFVAIFLFAVPFPMIIAAAAAYGAIVTRAGWLDAAAGPTTRTGPDTVADAATILGDGPALSGGIRIGWRLPVLIAALWLAPTAALLLLAGGSVFADIALFFSQMGVVTFGGAYAVLVYVGQAAVDHYGWMAPGEMLDGLGLAETTPGPLIIVTQFVGYLAAFRDPGPFSPAVAGVLGAVLTTWVTFAPCFLWIFLGAPYIERLRENRALAGALQAITAAIVGVVLNLAVWFGIHVIFSEVIRTSLGPLSLPVPTVASLEPLALLLSVLAIGALFSGRLGIMTVLGLSALLGIGAFAVGRVTV